MTTDLRFAAPRTRHWPKLARILETRPSEETSIAALLANLDVLEHTGREALLTTAPPVPWRTFAARRWRSLLPLLFPAMRAGAVSGSAPARETYEPRWGRVAGDAHRKRFREKDYLLDGECRRATGHLFWAVHTQLLARLFRTYLPPEVPVVELGSGMGRNLLLLTALAPDRAVHGYELTDAGRTTARRMADACGASLVTVRPIDLTDRDDVSRLPDLHGAPVCVITIGCLEGLAGHIEHIVGVLAGMRPVRVLHFEPLIELHAGPFPSRDFFVRRHLRRNGYQTTLLTSVRRLERTGRARIIHAERAGHGKPLLEYSVLVWEPLRT